HTVSNLLDPQRAARLVEQNALDPSLPGLQEVLDELLGSVQRARAATPYEAEVKRAVERVVVEQIMELAATARMPQVRALATDRLERLADTRTLASGQRPRDADAAHYALLARDSRRFLDRPAEPYRAPGTPGIPPGAPIGEPAMDWLGGAGAWQPSSARDLARAWLEQLEPACAWRWE